VFALGCQGELWGITGVVHVALQALRIEEGILEVERKGRRIVAMMMKVVLNHCLLVRLVRKRKTVSLLLAAADSGTSSLSASASAIAPDIGPIASSVTSSSVLVCRKPTLSSLLFRKAIRNESVGGDVDIVLGGDVDSLTGSVLSQNFPASRV
jgi:hypothetical protein